MGVTGRAATYTAASCSEADFQTAYASAVDGDTVQGPLAGGSATWGARWDITTSGKNTITLNGNGCIITLSSKDFVRMVPTSATQSARITNFTLTGTNSNGAVWIERGASNTPTFRVDHIIVTNLSTRFMVINYNNWATVTSQPYGVIDHITYTNNGSAQAIQLYGVNENWWSDPPLGTSSAVYVEDSTFTWSTGQWHSQSAMDCEHGGRLVFRYNAVANGSILHHDTGSTAASRGCQMYEHYGNVFTCAGSGGFTCFDHSSYRGGTGIDFNETIAINASGVGGFQYAISTENYRDSHAGGWPMDFLSGAATHAVCSSFKGWCTTDGGTTATTPAKACVDNSDCGGTNTCAHGAPPNDAACASSPGGTAYIKLTNIDGAGAGGYPSRDQIGVSKDDATTHAQTAGANPAYSWNLMNSNSGNAVITGGTAVNVRAADSGYIAANVEFYQYVAGFNGTVGVGRGLDAAKPATCTPKVGYFSTDVGANGTLYQCSALNTWTVYYTPLAYPHTLNTGPFFDSPTTSIAFAAQKTGTTSGTTPAVYTNHQAVGVYTIAAVTGVVSSDPTHFPVTWTPGTVAAQSTYTIQVAFAPALAQAYTGTITVTSDAPSPDNSLTISLSGTGQAAPDPPTASLSCAPSPSVVYGGTITCTPATADATSCSYSLAITWDAGGSTWINNTALPNCTDPFTLQTAGAGDLAIYTFTLTAVGDGGSTSSTSQVVYSQKPVAAIGVPY